MSSNGKIYFERLNHTRETCLDAMKEFVILTIPFELSVENVITLHALPPMERGKFEVDIQNKIEPAVRNWLANSSDWFKYPIIDCAVNFKKEKIFVMLHVDDQDSDILGEVLEKKFEDATTQIEKNLEERKMYYDNELDKLIKKVEAEAAAAAVDEEEKSFFRKVADAFKLSEKEAGRKWRKK